MFRILLLLLTYWTHSSTGTSHFVTGNKRRHKILGITVTTMSIKSLTSLYVALRTNKTIQFTAANILPHIETRTHKESPGFGNCFLYYNKSLINAGRLTWTSPTQHARLDALWAALNTLLTKHTPSKIQWNHGIRGMRHATVKTTQFEHTKIMLAWLKVPRKILHNIKNATSSLF